MKFSDEELFLLMLLWLEGKNVLDEFVKNCDSPDLLLPLWWAYPAIFPSIEQGFPWELSPEGFIFWADLQAEWVNYKNEMGL